MPALRLSLLVALALSLPLAAPAQTPDADVAVEARRVVEQLLAGRYDAVTARFDSAMAEALPEAQLRAVTQGLTAQAGTLVEQVDARVERQGAYRIAVLSLLFERAGLDARVAFDAEGRVSGLFFRPNPALLPYAPPPYADTSAFGERPLPVTRTDGAPPLEGTLTLPRGEGPFPAVVLVHGSGAHDRDESIGPNKPFRDLAYGLASRGVAVLRYDKRTLAHPEGFAPGTAYTVEEEVLADAHAAAEALADVPDVDGERVFALGHSLGGLLVPRLVAATDALAGGILAAAPSRPMPRLVLDQADHLAALDTTGAQREALEHLRREARRADTLSAAAPDTLRVLGAPARYWRDLAAYDPLATARALDRPLLVLHAGRDYQVTDADYAGWQRALGGRADVELRRYPALNHLFQPGEGPSTPEEYTHPIHVAAEIVEDVAAWIRRR